MLLLLLLHHGRSAPCVLSIEHLEEVLLDFHDFLLFFQVFLDVIDLERCFQVDPFLVRLGLGRAQSLLKLEFLV